MKSIDLIQKINHEIEVNLNELSHKHNRNLMV